MLETRAIVIRLEGAEAIVEARHGGGCGHCSSEGGCGSGKISQLFCTEPRYFRVRNGIDARVGDEVQVSVGEGVLLRSAAILYGLPLLLLLAGGMAGAQWPGDAAGRDAAAAVGALTGLAIGFLVAKRLASSRLAISSVAPSIVRLDKTVHFN